MLIFICIFIAVKPLFCLSYLKYFLVYVSAVFIQYNCYSICMPLAVYSVLAHYNLYDLQPQCCLLRWQGKWHGYLHLMIRNQASKRLIERLKVPVLANGGVAASRSKVVLTSVEGNFQVSKGHCPYGVHYPIRSQKKKNTRKYVRNMHWGYMGIYVVVQI